MTLTTSRTRSRFYWVPAAAGWFLGVIATASLLSSVSPLIRHLTKVPREFIDKIVCPLGDKLGDNTPGEIAVGIVSQLLRLRNAG